MMNFTEALIYLKGSKDMVARSIWTNKALINYKGEIMFINLLIGVRYPVTLIIKDIDAEDWSVVETKEDEPENKKMSIDSKVKSIKHRVNRIYNEVFMAKSVDLTTDKEMLHLKGKRDDNDSKKRLIAIMSESGRTDEDKKALKNESLKRDKEVAFIRAMAVVINIYHIDHYMNIPDYILADHLNDELHSIGNLRSKIRYHEGVEKALKKE